MSTGQQRPRATVAATVEVAALAALDNLDAAAQLPVGTTVEMVVGGVLPTS